MKVTALNIGKNVSSVLNASLCDKEQAQFHKKDCLWRKCEVCGTHKLKNFLLEELEEKLEHDVFWKEWREVAIGEDKNGKKRH